MIPDVPTRQRGGRTRHDTGVSIGASELWRASVVTVSCRTLASAATCSAFSLSSSNSADTKAACHDVPADKRCTGQPWSVAVFAPRSCIFLLAIASSSCIFTLLLFINSRFFCVASSILVTSRCLSVSVFGSVPLPPALHTALLGRFRAT